MFGRLTLQERNLVITNTPLALTACWIPWETVTRQQALQSLKYGKKECEALSPVELVYFSSSTTGHPGAAGFGVCRTLVLVALLYFSSPKRFSQVGDHSLDHFRMKYVPVKQWEMVLLCQCENSTQHNTVLKRCCFPKGSTWEQRDATQRYGIILSCQTFVFCHYM